MSLLALGFAAVAMVFAFLAWRVARRIEHGLRQFDQQARRFWDTNIWHHARTEALMKGESLPAHPASRNASGVQDNVRSSFSRSDD